MKDLSTENFIINVFKPKGITSQGVVTAVKRRLNVKTAGHCGTLDPLATGVLPVMVGRAVKASEYLTDHDKLYVARMRLGVVTDTGDITGNILKTYEGKLPTVFEVSQVLPKFTGEIIQVPPMYSALKVDGKKLVDLARQGIEVERKGRKINIYSLSAEDGFVFDSCSAAEGDIAPSSSADGGDSSVPFFDRASGDIVLRVLCSRGTYIRTLIEDMGNALGCGATMTALCRSGVGNVVCTTDEKLFVSHRDEENFDGSLDGKAKECVFRPMFSERDAVSLDDLKNGIIPDSAVTYVEDVFSKYKGISFPEFYERLFSNGCEIYVSKLSTDHPAKNANIGDVFRIYGKNGFFALGEVKEYENGIAIKQIKRF